MNDCNDSPITIKDIENMSYDGSPTCLTAKLTLKEYLKTFLLEYREKCPEKFTIPLYVYTSVDTWLVNSLTNFCKTNDIDQCGRIELEEFIETFLPRALRGACSTTFTFSARNSQVAEHTRQLIISICDELEIDAVHAEQKKRLTPFCKSYKLYLRTSPKFSHNEGALLSAKNVFPNC